MHVRVGLCTHTDWQLAFRLGSYTMGMGEFGVDSTLFRGSAKWQGICSRNASAVHEGLARLEEKDRAYRHVRRLLVLLNRALWRGYDRAVGCAARNSCRSAAPMRRS